MTEFDLFLFNLKRKKKLKIWNNNNWIDLLNLLKWANFLLKINTICIILSANIPNTNSTKSKIVWNSYSLNHLLYMCFVWATTRKKNHELVCWFHLNIFIFSSETFISFCPVLFVCFPTWNAFSLHMAAQIKRLWAYLCIFIMNYNNSIIKRLI